jgi:hypothetical protein
VADEHRIEDTAIATLADRRGAMAKPQTLHLYADRIERVRDGVVDARLRLDAIRRVRLAVEMAGREAQVVCRVTGPSGEMALGSLSATGPGQWTNNAANFRAFVIALHEALAPRAAEVEFLQGPSLGLRIALSALGAAMALTGAFFFAWFFLVEERAALGFVAAPFAVLGAYVAWLFRPTPPQPYAPEEMAKTLREQAERSANPGAG